VLDRLRRGAFAPAGCHDERGGGQHKNCAWAQFDASL
jgi:hypothetical protein